MARVSRTVLSLTTSSPPCFITLTTFQFYNFSHVSINLLRICVLLKPFGLVQLIFWNVRFLSMDERRNGTEKDENRLRFCFVGTSRCAPRLFVLHFPILFKVHMNGWYTENSQIKLLRIEIRKSISPFYLFIFRIVRMLSVSFRFCCFFSLFIRDHQWSRKAYKTCDLLDLLCFSIYAQRHIHTHRRSKKERRR